MNGFEVIGQVLAREMDAHDSIHLVGEALPLSGAAAAMLSAHPERCHLLPAADATLIGVAIGLALSGRTPVVELSSADALWGALQQLGQETAALAGEFRSTLVIRVPMGPDSPSPIPLLQSIPHVAVASPSSAAEAGALLNAALNSSGVTVLLEPIGILGTSGGAAAEATLGKACVVEAGEHITLAAWGTGVQKATEAARTLAQDGISAEVIDLRSLAPLDTQTLGASVHKTGRLILVDGGTEMLSIATRHCFLRLESPPALANAETIISKARAAVNY
jgi:pyruvate/2-oxoglutarate/acetoin dehydrogenase E1 component